ncbi:hypothetical protein [Achromobacter aegrifaciens]
MKIQQALLAIGLAGVCASSFADEAPFEVSLVFIQNVPVIQIETQEAGHCAGRCQKCSDDPPVGRHGADVL